MQAAYHHSATSGIVSAQRWIGQLISVNAGGDMHRRWTICNEGLDGKCRKVRILG